MFCAKYLSIATSDGLVTVFQILVDEHLHHSLWTLSYAHQSLQSRKQILKAVLCGLAALHSKDIVHPGSVCHSREPVLMYHTDIKPFNILVNTQSIENEIVIDHVKLIDLENTM